ncbi:hypothetical protein [Actinomadura opuntiae]|uniref:hypothetical protein n=1 Tax=Actinomadura sp. OS1-43 TaxID=604315 RepID=UPI00255B2B1B|nr:hypothetical protein [Actinomadura sp. OS1-43]MDL4812759.1 hypothetical protein [Actinomadura sp. OS1-43]
MERIEDKVEQITELDTCSRNPRCARLRREDPDEAGVQVWVEARLGGRAYRFRGEGCDANYAEDDAQEHAAAYLGDDAVFGQRLIEAPAERVDAADLLGRVFLTPEAWDRCVAWSEEDGDRTGVLLQDRDGRLLDVLRALADAIRRAGPLNRTRPLPFDVACFLRDVVFDPDDDREPAYVALEASFARDGNGDHLFTVREPH